MNEPFVGIVMLNWNSRKETIECIESLKKIDYKNWKVVIVDNASHEFDVEILKEKYERDIHVALIANDKNSGFPGGCNIGIKHAIKEGAEYILLLNNDTIVSKNFLHMLVNTAEQDKNVGIVASMIYYYYQPEKIQYIGNNVNWWLGINGGYICDEIDKGQHTGIFEKDYVPGTSCLIKREVIEKVGLLDEYYFFSIEEFDYCARVKKAGYRILLDSYSKVWHKWATASKKMSQYPETQRMIEQKVGWRSYKLWWKLYKDYSSRVWFVVPFLLQITFIGPAVALVLKGKWKVTCKIILNKLFKRKTWLSK